MKEFVVIGLETRVCTHVHLYIVQYEELDAFDKYCGN